MDTGNRPEQAPASGADRARAAARLRLRALHRGGALAGRLTGLLADRLATLPLPSVGELARIVGALPGAVLPAAGAAGGVALGFMAQREQLALSLSDERVVLERKGRREEFTREEIAPAFRDGSRLVLLGPDGGELTRQDCDLDGGSVAAAFARHRYTWAEEDPYRDDFRRWVPDAPGLPEGADAVLKARQKALDKDDPSERNLVELRAELARLGVVVKDEKRRPYWRPRGQGHKALD